MDLTLKPELESFIDEQIRRERFASRDEAMNAAVELRRRQQEAIASTNATLDRGLDDADAGRLNTWDADQVKRLGRDELARRHRDCWHGSSEHRPRATTSTRSGCTSPTTV